MLGYLFCTTLAEFFPNIFLHKHDITTRLFFWFCCSFSILEQEVPDGGLLLEPQTANGAGALSASGLLP